MLTGEGMLGKAMQKGFGGIIPMQIARNAAEEEEEKKKRQAGAAPASGMKKGGKVKASSASKRADGCAMRGKTRGKFV
jgi:hypothetical protein